MDRLVADDTDLLIDLLAYRAADVRAVLPAMSRVACPVVVSGRAVYVDPAGRHLNSDRPPHFPGPIAEDASTVTPAAGDIDPFTREGYGPSKVAAERVALDSGLPVTVLRLSKVHGRWARTARTRPFVEAMVRGDRTIELANASAVDHLTAADNTAALIETVAGRPGARILNSADPDTPTASQIITAIAERLGWDGTLQTVTGGADASRGRHPWDAAHPVVLDTSATLALGYVPAGSAVQLLGREVDWVAERIVERQVGGSYVAGQLDAH